MKKNLSKNTAKALAVGLAVGLGSSAAISGVSGVNAQGIEAHAEINATDVSYIKANGSESNKIEIAVTGLLKFTTDIGDSNREASYAQFAISEGTTENVTISNVKFADGKITLTLNEDLADGTYKLSYTGAGNLIVDDATSSDNLANFSEKEFTVDKTAPSIVESDLAVTNNSNDKAVITINFNEKILLTDEVKEDFNITKGGNKVEVLSVEKKSGSETAIEITLDDKAIDGDEYTVNYTPGTNKITDEAENEVSAIQDKKVTFTAQGIAVGSEVDIKQDGFIYTIEILTVDTNSGTAKLKSKSTASTTRTTSDTIKNGIVNIENKEIKITEIGNGTDALTSDSAVKFTVEELNNLCAEATIIKAKAFDGVATEGTTISFPKVTEVEANSLAFASGIGEVSLPAVTDATKVNTSAFKLSSTNANGSITKLKVDKKIESQFKNIDLGVTVETISTTTTTTTTTKPSNGSGSGAIINSAGQTQTTVEGQTEATTSQIITKNLSLDKVNLPTISDAMKNFTDIPATHWASEAIGRLSSAGIIQGMPNGTFNANGNTKRADMAVMLVRLLGINETFSENFSDVAPNAYYANAVGIAREYGIITGSTDGKFNPNANISRQDTMVMIARILQNLGISVNNDTSVLAQFSDSANISQYALESTAILVNAGIINGNDGKINPKAPITRAEIAVVMNKLYSIIEESKKTATTTTEATTETTTAKDGSTETTTSKDGSTETTTKEGTTETTTEKTTETTTK
ncbi:MAG: S-layer homology domain-containing protein [Eubacteriales bacterium]|nr:S-layer homology domain-containing protein [Eubacteriales bacterium]